ncbi:protein FAM210B, mitochondrial [Gouania willdenowi]|uniref:protein FAM210B, mitochondrial n=1 Tax=Gouania willdenowi TaxID=441366 RepID=UPI00105442F9|nr:protein FAM210B, mitochondrial [Gouania willdenowi]
MFLRCTGCLSALKHTLKKSPGWCLVLVSTNGLRDVPVTARTFQRHRVLSTVFLDKQRPLPGHSRHTSCGSGVSGWTQSERVSTVAVELLKSTDRDRYEVLSSTNRRHQRSSDGLFTADRRISMQTRSSSSSQSSSSNKAEVETLKEASAPSSSSPEKASGDEEPEGGKPNKTQQLKKVFKEYGAVGVSFHIGISLMSLGMFYLLISR